MEESNNMQEQEHVNVAPPTPTISYIGVRKRKWGKFVSEIREPGKKSRIWLGSYEEPQMAAAAYDIAAFHLKGHAARLNFPDMIEKLPMPASSKAEDIRVAAQQGALQFKRKPSSSSSSEGGVNSINNSDSNSNNGSVAPARVGLSPSQIQAINEAPFDSPKMSMQMFGFQFDEYRNYDNNVLELSEWEEIQYESLWD
jgi:hypothetical protein